MIIPNINNAGAINEIYGPTGIQNTITAATDTNTTITIPDDKNTLSKEGSLRGSYLVQLFKGFDNEMNEDGTIKVEKTLENISKIYTDLLVEIKDQYQDDESELYRHVEALNQAFDGSIRTTTKNLMFLAKSKEYTSKAKGVDSNNAHHSYAIQNDDKNALSNKHQNNEVLRNIQSNLDRHNSRFFENFIRSADNEDFMSAFSKSMEQISNSETTSYENISYNDIKMIMDNILFSQSSFSQTLKDMAEDEDTNTVVRNWLSQVYGLNLNGIR